MDVTRVAHDSRKAHIVDRVRNSLNFVARRKCKSLSHIEEHQKTNQEPHNLV